jgi:hypothetical protein
MKPSAALLRVAIGLLGLLFFFGAFIAHGEEIALPYANANGYSTTLVKINPTDQTIVHPVLIISPPLVELFEPRSVVRSPFGPEGVGVLTIEIPEGVVAYVEFTTPLGTIARAHPLELMTGAYLFDVPTDETLESHVFVSSPGGGAYTLTSGEDVHRGYLQPGEAQLIPVAGPVTHVSLGWGAVAPPADSLYVFAIVVHDLTGAITVVNAHPE